MNGKADGVRWAMWIAFGVWAISALPGLAATSDKPKLDVPYVPTKQSAVDEMLMVAKVTSDDYVIDLGCGDGRIVITAAKKHKARGLGVDLNPKRIGESKRNASKAGVTNLVEFRQADVMKTDVRRATVVTLFLLTEVNLWLRPRLFDQLAPGTRVVSNSFSMRDWKPDREVKHPDAYNKVIYFWVIPAPVGGAWTWRTTLGGKDVTGSLKIEQEFQAVQGTVSLPKAAAVPITEASLTGKELRFTATVGAGDEKAAVVYRGNANGDQIKGTQMWSGGPNAGTYPWIAKRKAIDLTGRWRLRAPARFKRNGVLCIRSGASDLSAAYVFDDQPKKELPLAGFYVWGSNVRFEIPAGRRSPLIFSGSLGPDAGGGSMSREESRLRATWSAKRLTADKKQGGNPAKKG